MQDAGYKQCSKCGETKPRTDFNRHPGCADGLRPECRACLAAFNRAYRERNRERIQRARRERAELTAAERNERKRKPCPRCGGPKEPGERRRYCEACKPLAAEEQRQRKNAGNLRWYYANFDRISAERSAMRDDPEFVRTTAERVKAWNAANPERAAAHRRDKVNRYRARQYAAWVEHVDHRIVFDRDGGICGICGDPVDPANFHIDHVVPIARGGEHSYANAQIAHPACNQRKGVRLLTP
jgi:5-methylcytosine-specific restriction endonuclease McrA